VRKSSAKCALSRSLTFVAPNALKTRAQHAEPGVSRTNGLATTAVLAAALSRTQRAAIFDVRHAPRLLLLCRAHEMRKVHRFCEWSEQARGRMRFSLVCVRFATRPAAPIRSTLRHAALQSRNAAAHTRRTSFKRHLLPTLDSRCLKRDRSTLTSSRPLCTMAQWRCQIRVKHTLIA
jgi:hypothetical protein